MGILLYGKIFYVEYTVRLATGLTDFLNQFPNLIWLQFPEEKLLAALSDFVSDKPEPSLSETVA